MHRVAAFAFAFVLTACEETPPKLPDPGCDDGVNAIANQARAGTVVSDTRATSDGDHDCWTRRLTIGQSTKDDVVKLAGRLHETSVWKAGKGKCVELWYWGGDSGEGLGPAVYFDAQGVVCMISAETRDRASR